MDEDRRFYVYAYYEPGSEEPFYVGKGQGKRAKSHLGSYELRKNDWFHNKLRGMLDRGIQPEIRIIEDELFDWEATELEIYLIEYWGRRDIGTGCLCNQTIGGQGTVGRIASLETRIKISASNLGKVHTEAVKARMSKSTMGYQLSDEAREKLSKSLTGRNVEKAVATRLAKYGKAVVAADPKTNKVVGIYKSVTRTGYPNFKNILDALRGRSRTSYGLHWRYATDEESVRAIDASQLVPKYGIDPYQAEIAKVDLETGEEIQRYKSVRDTEYLSPQRIMLALRGKLKNVYGFAWRFTGPLSDLKGCLRDLPVEALDTDTGTVVRRFRSAKHTGLDNPGHVVAAAKGLIPSAYGYKWRFIQGLSDKGIEGLPLSQPPFSPKVKVDNYSRPIAAIGPKTGDVVKQYTSVRDIEYANKQFVMQVLIGKRKTAYGYKWRFLDRPCNQGG